MLRPDFHKCQSHCPEPKMMRVNAIFEIVRKKLKPHATRVN